MKFISKNQNLRLVLRPGIPANQMAGQPGKPGWYVKFQQGILTVPDEEEETVMMLKQHPGFNIDYILAEEDQSDPYARRRTEPEPEHSIMEIEYGHPAKSINPRRPTLSPELKFMVEDMAKEMATKMATEMMKTMISKFSQPPVPTAMEEAAVQVETAKKRGRPPKETTSTQKSEA